MSGFTLHSDGPRVRAPVRGLLTLLALCAFGCEESLPPRQEPSEVLSAGVDLLNTTIQCRLSDSTVYGGSGALIMQVKNTYTDVLSDSEQIQANITLYLKSQPGLVATLSADRNDVTNYYLLLWGSTLTLGVDSSVVMIKVSQFKTSDGVPIWKLLDFTFHHVGNASWYETSPQVLVVDALIQVFKRFPAIKVRKEFTVVFQIW